MSEDELDSSELGTLDYWQQRYKDEIKNFARHGDIGEVWFGEDIVDRIINWISQNVEKDANIVDVGCGNGHVLLELAQLGYKYLSGLDYSDEAINLAKIIAKKQDINIQYSTNNVLEGLPNVYRVIHDKGTYDAISLSKHSKENREKYVSNIHKSLENDGYFIITSCNWTQTELVDHFGNKFELYKVIPTPQFKFGGKVGNVVSICVFKKNITLVI